MAPVRKPSNGRSPLVNPQRQITSFFSKSPTPSPSPSLPKKKTPNSNPNPNPTPSPSPSPTPITPSPLQSKPKKTLLVIGQPPKSNPNPSPSPTTPSPLQSKHKKKTLLVIDQSPSPSPSPATPATAVTSCGKEVVEKRIRVYWPLDDIWYEGCVKSYNEASGKHLVQYDDFEEEMLDLGKEKFEWVEETAKKFKRLRRGVLGVKKMVIDDEDEENSGGSQGDDSSDEDWGKKVDKSGSEEEVEEMDLEDEEAEEIVQDDKKGKKSGKSDSRKRKVNGGGNLGSVKKGKSSPDVSSDGTFKCSVPEIEKDKQNGLSTVFNDALVSDVSERFGIRDAEKFPFLGAGRRDAKRRRPVDVGYDPRTLYLPPEFVKSLSGGQRQWWEFKSKHMDKVLFFKMGKFYELFEMDAHVGAKELDLQYMKGEQPHCGFPEKNFSMHVEKLARKGYRVLVIEQTETPEQLELRRKEGSRDKVVKREICSVVTKGTLTEGELLSANPDACYLMAVTESCGVSAGQRFERSFGVCVVDVATGRIILGQFGDDAECGSLCSLLSELRPVEIIKPAKLLSSETESMIVRHTRNPLVNELVQESEFWDAEKTIFEVKTFYKNISTEPASESVGEADINSSDLHVQDGVECLPGILSELVNKGESGNLALSALGGTLYYLKQAFLDEALLRFAKFESLPCSDFNEVTKKPYMILDAAALENLEVFENSRNGDSSGTLYAQLNHCVTAFGKRLLKTWLARPLYDLGSIKDRQDAVAGLQGENQPMALEFQKALSRLPDMERLLARIFSSSEANGRNASKVVLYEDASKKQLQEFISALRGCELTAQASSPLSVIAENVESGRLRHLLTPGKGLPDIHSILKHFKDAFDWAEANNSGRIIPCDGVDLEYDSACKRVKEIESGLTKHLKEQRKLLGEASIIYVTVGKDAYLLEVPEHLRGNIPCDYELRSSKKGFYRYWTPSIKKFLGELSLAESGKETALKSILQRLIARFCEHHDKWRQLVSVTAELDALISLAIASDFFEGPVCRPVILDLSQSSEFPCFEAKSLGHPILRSDSLGKGAFVPNDINIGGSSSASFLLLTGPNMGGKSTLLRQVCLAVILAQVGAHVAAESFELSPVDRIFVRMGAKDHIMTGQSTFLTELSETALMLSSATRNSLVALDELGRGTSTSDGQAIAEAVLDHFVHRVHCRGMFSTHYHRLAIDYQNDPKVSLCHMSCKVGDGEEDVEEVTFLHRLTSGACPKSYGVNVARLAGLPDSVLLKAAAKSKQFEATYGKNGTGHRGSQTSQRCDEIVAFIQNLFKDATNFSSGSSCKSLRASSLTELQAQAKSLTGQN